MRPLMTLALAAGLAAPATTLALDAVLVGSGFDSPVFLTAPTGDARLFIVEQGGRIRMMNNGSVSTYLDLSGLVDATGERGLLGLAFDPGFASNGRFYVNYIDKVTLNTVVAAYNAPSAAAAAADPGSGRTILTVAQPAGLANHKAGWIGFRPGDGSNLYIATGDGGGANDAGNRAQNLGDNLGKILRVTPQAGGGYTVPAGNPFAGAVAGNDEIWAWGLRNPYRNSFDRLTGDFWIGDVGQDAREEIDLELAGTAGGRNYGWRAREGSADNPAVSDPAPAGAIDPVFDYAHETLGATVIGGYVYHGSGEAALDGRYVFGDFVSGRIFSLQESGGGVGGLVEHTDDLGDPFGEFALTSFGEDGLGNLYAMGLDGSVYRIAAAVPEPQAWTMLGAGVLLLGWLHRRRGWRER